MRRRREEETSKAQRRVKETIKGRVAETGAGVRWCGREDNGSRRVVGATGRKEREGEREGKRKRKERVRNQHCGG